jgi:hypothetical protein
MPKLTKHEKPPTGAAVKGAQYRETLQTTGYYVDRIVIVPREFAPMPRPLLRSRGRLVSRWPSEGVFSGMAESISPIRGCFCKPKPGLEHRLPPIAPDPGLRTRREERALLIVPMSSGWLFLDRVARQHCPSPLHQHAQHNSIAGSKGTNYHRTVGCVLTVCLSPGDKRIRSVVRLPLSTVLRHSLDL